MWYTCNHLKEFNQWFLYLPLTYVSNSNLKCKSTLKQHQTQLLPTHAGTCCIVTFMFYVVCIVCPVCLRYVFSGILCHLYVLCCALCVLFVFVTCSQAYYATFMFYAVHCVSCLSLLCVVGQPVRPPRGAWWKQLNMTIMLLPLQLCTRKWLLMLLAGPVQIAQLTSWLSGCKCKILWA